MKRILLVVAVVFATVTYAQTGKGNWMVGADLGLSFQSKNVVEKDDQVQYMDQTITTFKITPNFNYFVVNNLAVGLGVGYEHSRDKRANSSWDTETNTLIIAPNVHYYFPTGGSLAPFVGARVGFTSRKNPSGSGAGEWRGLVVGGKAGLAYFVNRGAAITAYAEYDHFSLKHTENTKRKTKEGVLGVGIGVALFF